MTDTSNVEAESEAPRELTPDEKWWSDLEKVNNLLWRDKPKEPVDTLYFFGRSFFDAPKWGLYKIAAELYKERMCKKIIVPGTEGERLGEDIPRASQPGKTLMKSRLVGMGVDRDDVVFSGPGYHTKAEGDAFLDYSIQHNHYRAIAIANPHQITRAMLGLVRTMLDRNLPIDVYAVTPDPNKFDWQRRVKGSQGMERKRAFEHIQDEIDRIVTYQQGGDLASFDELSTYMLQRGKGGTEIELSA